MTVRAAAVKGVRYFLAHVPGLVRHGSKPTREIEARPGLLADLRSHLRVYDAALAYPPNRVFLGAMRPDELAALPRPWWRCAGAGASTRRMPHGELMPEEEFYALLKAVDRFDLIWLDERFAGEVRARLMGHGLVTPDDLASLEPGHTGAAIGARVATGQALPLELGDGRLIGCCNRAHEQDATLGADVLLENLASVASATMAARALIADLGADAARVGYVIGSGEEAIGDRYQRGGGSLGKVVAERAGLPRATGSDVKAFCCGPNHAMAIAAGLVCAGVFGEVLVVGGGSLAKLGMKAPGHIAKDMPVLEDTLAAFAVWVGPDDGDSPLMPLDAFGHQGVATGAGQQAILESLLVEPLASRGLRLVDVDRYATELHNPEVTEPAGSGDVPLTNYRMIAGLAALRGEIAPSEVAAFVAARGMTGFSPTQGHVASSVPYLGHAIDGLRAGELERVQFVAKGSLFLGRMTQMSDGFSFLLERNHGTGI